MIYKPTKPFKPKFLFKNKHFNTAYRYYLSNYKINYKRKRFFTEDGDFLDLDYSLVDSSSVVLAIHGLEGSSNSSYIKSLTQILNKNNYDVIAINLRSCSGETNNLLSSYHSGKSDDLLEIIQFIEKEYQYKEIHIVGYSLGGNIALKFMGEVGEKTIVKSTIAVSVPCSLKGSSVEMEKKGNKMYVKNFLKTLTVKVQEKFNNFPDANLETDKVLKATSFKEFDHYFTAPTNGFKSGDDYYKKASCKQYLPFIKKPALLITALDDPFLNEDCYPIKEAKNSKHFHLLTTNFGGHVGFCHSLSMKNNNWLENEILFFIENNK